MKEKINPKTGKPFKKKKRNGLQWDKDKGTYRDDGSTQKSEKTCDVCGNKFTGKSFPVYDENNNEQKGLIQCGECLINN